MKENEYSINNVEHVEEKVNLKGEIEKMKTIKFRIYSDLEKVKEIKENEFIINIEDCPTKQKVRIIDFFAGLTYFNGSMKKHNTYEYEIQMGEKNGK